MTTPDEKQPRQSSALDSIRKKRPNIKADMAKRSWRVMLLKRILPGVAVLLLIALTLAPSWHSGVDSGRIAYNMTKTKSSETSSIEGATYRGRDQHGQPYVITAANVIQRTGGAALLTGPQGSITLKSGTWLMLKSDAGKYYQKTEDLDLSGNVMLYRNDGTIMTTSKANINLRTKSAEGNAPVRVTGPFGVLDAQNGFTLTDHGDQIMFNGPAKLVLDQVQ